MSVGPTFQIGDKVVYPNHGVGVIEQVSSRMLGASMQKFYTLKIKASSLVVTIPAMNADAVGLRKVAKNGEIQKILDYLSKGDYSTTADWKDRYKENCDKMRTGTLMETAMVLKGLLALNQNKPLSFREKKMLERAKYLLVCDLSLAKNCDENEMEDMLAKALAKSKLRFPDVTADA
jgi:CarD family transcriptional regulator